MKKEFMLAFNEVLEEKQLPREVILEAIQAAMVSAYRKTINASSAQQITAEFNPENGSVVVYAEKEVVEDVVDDRTEVLLDEALEQHPDAELGEILMVESTPESFGRVAAQTARQVIQQRIREAERDAQFKHYNQQVGEIVNGIVQAINPQFLTLGLDRKAEGKMPRKAQIRGERFRVHDRVRALLAEVKQTPRGPEIILSRAHRNFLRRLLEDEVPEIYNGLVEIRSIAREPGYRSKVAVSALQPGIDPVGACVGIRGVRIQAIVRELNDEKIDVIEWNPNPVQFIAKALSPARVTGVYLQDTDSEIKTATVVVPEDQLSLAIGRDGQNARLAAKLTAWRIDIKSLIEAASESLVKMLEDPEQAEIKEKLTEIIPIVEGALAKKAEGRPVSPEEYQQMSRLVDAVQRGEIDRRQAEMAEQKSREAEARKAVPDCAYDIVLDDLGLSPRINILLTGEGYSTIGDLMFQLEVDADAILALNGVGPKVMDDVYAALEAYDLPVEEEAEAEETAPEDAAEDDTVEETEAVAEEIAEAEAQEEPAAEKQPEAVTEAAEPADEQATVEEPAVVKEELAAEKRLAAEKQLAAETDKPEAVAEEVLEEPQKKARKAQKPQKQTLKFVEDSEPKLEDDKKSHKKKRRFDEVMYDPDEDIIVVKRRRKREQDEWDEWDF